MELPSAGPCCSSWMVWHSAGGWACVKTAFLTTQARHSSCILSRVSGTSLTGLEGFPCLYIFYCIICHAGKSLPSNHFSLISAFLVLPPLRNEIIPHHACRTSTPCKAVPRSPYTSLSSPGTPSSPCRKTTSLPSIGPTPSLHRRSATNHWSHAARPAPSTGPPLTLPPPSPPGPSGPARLEKFQKNRARPEKIAGSPHPFHQPSCTFLPSTSPSLQPLPG